MGLSYDEFAEELEAIDDIIMGLHNAAYMIKDDEANDPEEDDKLNLLLSLSTDLQYAAETLNDAVSKEYRRRDDLYEETDTEEKPYGN